MLTFGASHGAKGFMSGGSKFIGKLKTNISHPGLS